MDMETYKCKLIELSEDELYAYTVFTQWDKAKGQALELDDLRVPLVRPQGVTVDIPDSCIRDNIAFSHNSSIAVTRHPRYYTAVPHSHTFFEIVVVCNGICRQWIEDQVIVMWPGDVCILPPHVRHAPEAFSPSDVILNLQIRQETFQTIFSDVAGHNNLISSFYEHIFYDQPDKFLLVSTGDDSDIQQLALRMHMEYQQQDHSTQKILELTMSLFLAELLRRYGDAVQVYSICEQRTNEVIVPILLFMQDHLSTVSLDSLSQEFHYSVSQLSRMFHRYTGKTYSTCLREFRLQRAAELLEHTETPIPEVAEQSGFNNMSNFYRQFRQQYDVTPADYRASFTT